MLEAEQNDAQTTVKVAHQPQRDKKKDSELRMSFKEQRDLDTIEDKIAGL